MNSYINPIPGTTLTSAFKIDDVGQILAQGSDGHDYLLRPLVLGPPQTVPEPTAFMLLGFAGFSAGSCRDLRRNGTELPSQSCRLGFSLTSLGVLSG